MQGWISLHRKIQLHELWEDKPFSRGQAWIDILLMVNHKDEQTMFDGNMITVNRGSRITSIRKLSTRWGWSNSKVTKFLKLLESAQMLEYFSDTKKTVLTVANYDLYQNEETEKRHRNVTETSQKHTNNNDNKDNKNIYTDEFEKFWSEYPNKTGKSGTYKHWKRLVKEYGPDKLIKSAINYSIECEGKDKQYIKVGYNFFSDGVFENYLEVKKKPKPDNWKERIS